MQVLKTTVLTLAAVALLAAPARAHDTTTSGSCTPGGELSQAFLPFGDHGLYTPVENAGLEDASAGWELSGGALVTTGNEPWYVSGNRADNHSLALREGAAATSAPFCVDETFTHFRFFVRGAGKVRVDALYPDASGRLTSHTVDDVNGTSAWAPSPELPLEVVKRSGRATVPVAFRFTAKSGRVQLDDVYIDPWARS